MAGPSADEVRAVMAAVGGCECCGSPTAPINYKAVNNRSTARGGYQFLKGTWDNYAGFASADLAPPEVQDRKFFETWRDQGLRPWNASRHCWGRVIPAHLHGPQKDLPAPAGAGDGGGGLVGGIVDALNPADEIVSAIKGLLPTGWLKRLGKMALGTGMVWAGAQMSIGGGVIGAVAPKPVVRAAKKAGRAARVTGSPVQAVRAASAPRAASTSASAPPVAGVQGKATSQVVGDVMKAVSASSRPR